MKLVRSLLTILGSPIGFNRSTVFFGLTILATVLGATSSFADVTLLSQNYDDGVVPSTWFGFGAASRFAEAAATSPTGTAALNVSFTNTGTFAGTYFGPGNAGQSLGVLIADFTQDRFADVYVANDTTNNFFYENRNGTLSEIGLQNGTAVSDMGVPEGSMGICTLDYNGDLLPDILVSNYENQAFALYQNDGEGSFRYVSGPSGLKALGTNNVAWGIAASDFDGDGDEDVVIATGHVMMASDPAQHSLYLQNNGNGRFSRGAFSSENYFSKKWRGRGLVAFDLERDGDLDLAISNINQNATVLTNATLRSGSCWTLELIGTLSSRDPIGTNVLIVTDQRKILRTIVGGGSFLSQGPYYVHWCLPKGESLLQVDLVWPSGIEDTLTDLAENSHTRFVEKQPTKVSVSKQKE